MIKKFISLVLYIHYLCESAEMVVTDCGEAAAADEAMLLVIVTRGVDAALSITGT